MKKTTSLYLNELYANRVNRHLERALDGRGSLTGFFAWVAEQAHAALIEGGHQLSNRAEAQSALGRWLGLLESAAPDMDKYRHAWEAQARYWPWHPTNPAASHLLALFVLKRESPLWNRPRGTLQRSAQEAGLFYIGNGDPLEAFVEAARSEEPKKTEPVERQYYLLWHKDRLEILAEPPRSQPISLYVHPEAHGALLRAFQNTLFERLLGTLDDLLAQAWPRFPWLLAVLERPENFVTHRELLMADLFAEEPGPLPLLPVRRGIVSTLPASMTGSHWLRDLARTPEDITWLAERLKRCEDDNFSEKDHRRYGGKAKFDAEFYLLLSSFELDWQALNELVMRFGAAAVRKGLEEAAASNSEIRATGFATEIHPSVWMALDLGLLETPIQDVERLPAQAVGAFMARYGLRELRPERRLAYQVLRQILPQEERVQDPLEFHVLRLLQAYALAVLPEEEREPERVSHAMLCTLGQPDLFPVRDTLEAWTGLHVRADGPERWRFYQGRKLWKTLSSREAASAAHWLNQLAPVSHDYTAKGVGTVRWGLDLKALSILGIPSLLEADELRVVFALGPEVLEAVLELVAAYPGDQKTNWMRGTFQPLMTALIGRLRQRASVKARRVSA
ncbi:hypothetical protein [Meiothermus sp. CFH 77666]|uniref:hypothetical protein n=1 Tax=Meiothermus sp. CFH 77666 TaxID=2817942 RepID=UPI001AA037B9|nr:hypothetical protein [Meiothermus sp. CFH 77666]MBO1438669.1 hypothetical protein [Meiothermus sp. CFH 77666]